MRRGYAAGRSLRGLRRPPKSMTTPAKIEPLRYTCVAVRCPQYGVTADLPHSHEYAAATGDALVARPMPRPSPPPPTPPSRRPTAAEVDATDDD